MKKIIICAVSFLVFLFIILGIEIIDTGNRGIKTRFGEVIGSPLAEGIYFYNFFTSDIKEIDTKERKKEEKIECYTKDTQRVDVAYAITYYPQREYIHEVFKNFGGDWENRIINQVVVGNIKDVIGQVIADDLVSKRELITKNSEKMIKENLLKRNIIATRLDFTNLDFNDEYEKAVEEKVVAQQKAAKAKNETIMIEEQAKQTITKAKADAEAMKIKSDALKQNKGLVDYEIALKWNGVLPQYMFGNTTPLLNLNGGK